MDLCENEELREALLGPDGDDDLEFYITFPTPTALVSPQRGHSLMTSHKAVPNGGSSYM